MGGWRNEMAQESNEEANVSLATSSIQLQDSPHPYQWHLCSIYTKLPMLFI